MKLLLVEDEKLTRNGLLDHVDWENIGIKTIETAEDGQEGLQKALSFHPDIVMADIRMPHMDGITMAFELKRHIECQFIFMSGYSDKKYLKSAIELSAVNYIEKPIEPKEVIMSLKKAVNQVQESRRRALLELEYGSFLNDTSKTKDTENINNWDTTSALADMVDSYVEAHYRDNNLSLTAIADNFGLTKQYLCSIYKKEKKRTINQFITEKRLGWAKDYMKENRGCRVKDIARNTGFSDSNYFIKCFKKFNGVTPMDYKNIDEEGKDKI